MSRFILTSGSLLALYAATQPAWSAMTNSNPPAAQDNIVVTATRTEESSSAVLASATLINREDIERLQPQDVTDLFDKVPGATVTRAGGLGSQTSLFLRGTNNEHTLVLLDGQRISSATLGSTNFQFIDPEQIERIEVVRGPRSSLYGSDAIGGVVQIFTRSAEAAPHAYASAGYGSHDAYRTSAGGSERFGNLRVSGGASYYSTNGFSSLEDNRGAIGDNDNYRNSSINAKLGYDFDSGAKVDLMHFYTRTKNAFDNPNQPTLSPFGESWIQSTTLALHAPVTNFWNVSANVGRAINDEDSLHNESPTSHTHFRTTRNSVSWQNDFAIDETQTITAGVDYYKELIDSSTSYTDASGKKIDSRDTTGYFAQYLLNNEIFDVQIGARSDHIERVGMQTTGNASLGFNLPAQHRLILSAGTAFRAPTVNDLYWPIGTYDYGNPNLKPEKSKNYEVEVRGDYRPLQWSLNVYQNEVRDLIQWAEDPSSPVGAFTPSNVAKAKIRGGDFIISTKIEQWTFGGRLSYTNPRDEDTNLLLAKRNRRTLGIDADRKFGSVSIGANWLLQDSRYADAANTRKLGGFGVLDVHASYEPTPNWQISLRVNNVLDKEYATQSASWYDTNFNKQWTDYNSERLGWFATATYRM